MKRVWWVLLILFWWAPFDAHATMHNAATCSSVDIQAVINDAGTVSGDTVAIPAGTCTWTQPVYVRKDITLQGAGQGVTIIQDPGGFTAANYTHNCTLKQADPCGGNAALLYVTYIGSNATTTRVTAMTFIGGPNPPTPTPYLIWVQGSGIAKFRVDHITCQPFSAAKPYNRCLTDYSDDAGQSYHSGLVDHITCTVANAGGVCFNSETTLQAGSQMWTHPVELGTDKTTYFEDNILVFPTAASGDGCWDMYDGASYVMRYNQCQVGQAGNHGPDSGKYGQHVAEYYRNIYTNPFAQAQTSVEDPGRGSFQIMFDETATGVYNAASIIRIYRSDTNITTYPGDDVTTTFAIPFSFSSQAQVAVSERNIATGVLTKKANPTHFTVSGTNVIAAAPLSSAVEWTIHLDAQGKPTFPCSLQSAWDGNLGTVGQSNLGYPCFHQVGWSWPAIGWLGSTGVACTTEATCGQPNGVNAVHNPTYMWGNRLNGSLYQITTAPYPAGYVHVNAATPPSKIDIYSDNVTNHGASCTGGGACTVGIGVGTSLPTTCTVGVAFWKTNAGTWNVSGNGDPSGQLWKCTSTDTFTLFYEPYTYPHPLQGSAPVIPSAPTGLRVIGTSTGTTCSVVWDESAMSGLVGYHLRVGMSSGASDYFVANKTAAFSATAHQPPRQHTFQFPAVGTYYITVTSYSDTVADSAASSEVTCTSTGATRTAAGARTSIPLDRPRLPAYSATGDVLLETDDSLGLESSGAVLLENLGSNRLPRN